MLHECFGNFWQGGNCGPKQESHFSSMLFCGLKFEDVAFRCSSTCDHQTLHIIFSQYSEAYSIDTLGFGMQYIWNWSFCNRALVVGPSWNSWVWAELLGFLFVVGQMIHKNVWLNGQVCQMLLWRRWFDSQQVSWWQMPLLPTQFAVESNSLIFFIDNLKLHFVSDWNSVHKVYKVVPRLGVELALAFNKLHFKFDKVTGRSHGMVWVPPQPEYLASNLC